MPQKKTKDTQNNHKITVEKFNEFSSEVLKAVADLIERDFTTLEIIDILKLKSNFKQENHKQGLILRLFNDSKQNDSDLKKHKNRIKIIEKFMHPLSHLGDIKKTNTFREQIATILWHDNLIVEEDENRNYVILNVGESDIFTELLHDRVMEEHPYIEAEEIPSREEQMFVLKRKETKINESNQINIFYNINIGKFIFNNKESVELKGKQKDTADCLVNAGKEVKVSWDEIYEKFKDSLVDQDNPNKFEADKRKRSVRTSVTEINEHTKEYLRAELIGAKDNEYWLQFEVDKGR